MRFQMRLQVIRSGKLFITHVAEMFFLRFMNRLVLPDSRLGRETFRAERAEEGSGALVVFPKSVSSQSIASIEGLITLGTLEGLGPAVDPHVGPEGGLLAEGLATGVTHEGFVSGVSSDVILKLEHFLEIFTTEGAQSLPLLLLGEELRLRVGISGNFFSLHFNPLFPFSSVLVRTFRDCFLVFQRGFLFGFPPGRGQTKVSIAAVNGQGEILFILDLDVVQVVRVKELRSLYVHGDFRYGLEVLRKEAVG